MSKFDKLNAFITSDQLNTDWLKKNHQMIHYFGLGFIQLKLDATNRLHFYTEELPPIVNEEDVHNHRYDFLSVVLKGEFCQHTYNIVDGVTHTLEEESCRKDAPISFEPKLCGLEINSIHTYRAGSWYMICHNTFHQVFATNCITFLNRTDYKKENAQVVRPVGATKICPFSQQIEQSRLWEIVDSMLSP